MRCKKCIKFLIFSIISLLCSVSFLEDTNALSLTIDAEPTGQSFYVESWDCMYSAGTYTTNQSICQLAYEDQTINHKNVYAIRSRQKFDFKEGYYYEFFYALENPRYGRGGLEGITWFPVVKDSDWTLVDFEELSDEDSVNFMIYRLMSANGNYLESSSYSKIFRVILYSKTESNRAFIFGNESNTLFLMDATNLGTTTYGYTNIAVGQIREYKVHESAADEMNQKDDEDRDNIESQSSTASSDSDSSSEDASEAGTTLLGAFSAFVNALTSASPSTCVLDMDLGNLDLGNVDFCDLDPPSGFQTISSIFLILFCVPLSIATARKVISLFRSFQ